ncbi:MAG TPA: ATP-binding protein [Candidatus Synoicihabitans sp.]|nr:ATP-binding protein [Candidatus Synoicihabitans sp.]
MRSPVSIVEQFSTASPRASGTRDAELLRILTNESNLLIYDYDSRSGIVEWRGPLKRLLGYAGDAADRVEFTELCDLVHPEDAGLFRAGVNAALERDAAISFLVRLRDAHGSYRTFHQRGVRVAESPERIVGTLLDVSESDAQEHALRELLEHTASAAGAEFLERLVQQAGKLLRARRVVIAQLADPATFEFDIIAAWQEQGLARLESYRSVPGSPSWVALHEGFFEVPDKLAEVCPAQAARFESLGVTGYLGVALRVGQDAPLGVFAVMYGHGLPPHPQARPILRLFAGRTAVEVQRLTTERALRLAEERSRLLVEHAPEAILVLDAKSREIILCNREAERLFKLPRAQLLGRDPVSLSPPLQPDGLPSIGTERGHVQRALAGEQTIFEWLHRTSEGEDILCEVRLLRLPGEERLLLRGSLTDIGSKRLTGRAARVLSETTAGLTGMAFFGATVRMLVETLHVREALIAEFVENSPVRARVLAAWRDSRAIESPDFELAGTPGESVLDHRVCHLSEGVTALYPDDAQLAAIDAVGYFGLRIDDANGRPFGLVAIVDDKLLPDSEAARFLLAVSASRASAELQRLRHVAAIQALNAALEQRVADRTAQLLAANTELEAFSYSVSHDLRAPLRAIAGFSRALEQDYEAALDETGRDYLRRIQSSSKRMGGLIDDLLTLSRASRGEVRFESIDLTALARQVATEVATSAPERGVEVVIAEGLAARADADLLRVALTNLIDNAFKYTRKQPHPRVEVGRLPQPDENGAVIFLVRDNGAGFDMRQAGKLFTAFQRLHHPAEFEGSGIGLATVRRIIHRHGGRIWAESAAGQGATFFFTLSSYTPAA